MRDFLNRLRETRQAAKEQREQQAEAAARQREQERERRRLVDTAAQEIERYITDRLEDFRSEFVEFLFDSALDNGRVFRVRFNEPASSSDRRTRPKLHQLTFTVRRHHEYADVEVSVKPLIADKELPYRRREEDVYDGDPEKLKPFVDEQILRYSTDYLNQRNW